MSSTPIRYEITPKDVNAHIFQVSLTLDNPNPLGQVFSLPNWISGSYLIRDFSKNIVSIKAHSCSKFIEIKTLDKNHWIVHPCANSLTLEYKIYAFDLSVRCAYLTNQRAFFNGSSVFLQPIGFEDSICELQINYPTVKVLGDWDCATSLALKDKQKNKEIYTAKNYLDLIDHPVEMADFTRFEFSATNIPHAMTITGEHATDIDRLRADLSRICEHHIGFFGGNIPFDNYLFLTLATSKDYGGLEHKKSSSLICARKDLPALGQKDITPEYTRFLTLCSHEYFHAWWIKTIKPVSFHHLDMSRENYSEQLWIFEGFTSYYDELSLLRTGILSAEQYLELFSQTVSRVQKGYGRFRQSLAQSSFDAWTKFYQQDENAPNAIVSYYTKGALLAFVLDIEVRKRTNDKHSLDDVLRLIWGNYQASGLEDDTVQRVIEHLTQSDFTEFFEKYLYGVEELPLKATFQYVGVNCKFAHKKEDLSKLGIGINKAQKHAIISHVLECSCAQAAGLYVGDKIISINGDKVLTKDLKKTLNVYQQGERVKIGILRDDMPNNIELKIAFGEKTHCTLTLDTKANQSALNQQKKWIFLKPNA